MASESHKPTRRTTTRGRRLLQLVEVWFDGQVRKLRTAAERGLTALLVSALLAVFVSALLVLAASRLIDGLSHGLSAAWDGPAWTGDLAVGLLVPPLVIGWILRAHQRRARRRDAQSREKD